MSPAALAIHFVLLLGMPPLLPGIIAKTKAWFAGRAGPPLLQRYYDVAKLLRKGATYSSTTTWVFRAGPLVSLATAIAAGLLLPLSSRAAPLGFDGDVVLFAYLIALGRFATMAAAFDTGSSFEGMGASREGTFSALCEPALLSSLAAVCVATRSFSFQGAWVVLHESARSTPQPSYLVAAVALFVVLLAESSRVPVDDPNTHLELTMVHEVMVLDHGGPDLGFVLFGSAVKMFVVAALLVGVVSPVAAGGWQGVAVVVGGEVGVAVLVGVVESVMARLRLPRVPQLLIGASVMAALGLAFLFYRGLP